MLSDTDERTIIVIKYIQNLDLIYSQSDIYIKDIYIIKEYSLQQSLTKTNQKQFYFHDSA